MQAVLDTNIVVSALLWGGTPFKLLELATDGKLSLYTSPALIAELRDVLHRDHLAQRLATISAPIQQRDEAKKQLRALASKAKIHDVTSPGNESWDAIP